MSEENEIQIKLEAETDELQDSLKEALEQVKEVMEGIVEAFKKMAEAAVDSFNKVKNSANAGASGTVASGSLLVSTSKNLVNCFNDLFKVFSSEDIERFNKLNESFENLEKECAKLPGAFQKIGSAIGSFSTAMVQLIPSGQRIVAMMGSIFNAATTWIGNGIGWACQKASGAVLSLANKVVSLKDKLVKLSEDNSSLAGKIAAPIVATGRAIGSVASSVASFGGKMAAPIVATGRAIGSVASSVASFGGKIGSTLLKAGGSVASGVGSLMGSVPGLLNPAVAAVQVAIKAFAQMKEFADFSSKMIKSAGDMGQKLGMSATKASTLQFALKGLGGDSESYGKALEHIDETLHSNSESLEEMGIKTTDAKGNLRDSQDVYADAIKVIGSYKEGVERNAVAQKLLGMNIVDADAAMKISNETLQKAREKQESLGLVVGKDNVEAQKKYQEALHGVDDVTDGLKKTIGDVFMPVVTELGEWFSSIGPAAVKITRGAVGGLAATFWYLRNGMVVVWEVARAMFDSLKEIFLGLGEALGKALTGDFSGAANALKSHATDAQAAWSRALDNIAESSEKTRSEVAKIFMPTGEDAAEPSKAGKTRTKEKKKHGGNGEEDENKKALAQLKLEEEIEQKRYEVHLISDQQFLQKQEEFATRRYEIQMNILKKELSLSKEHTEKHKQTLNEMIALQVHHNQEMEALHAKEKPQEKEESDDDKALREIDVNEAIAKKQLDDKLIDQKKWLELEEQFENQRYEIKLKGIKERLALAAKEGKPEETKKAMQELEQLNKTHLGKLAEIKKQSVQQDKNLFLSAMKELGTKLTEAWTQHIDKLINGGFRWRNVYKDSVSVVRSWFTNHVKEMVKDWLLGEGSKTAATVAGTVERGAAESAASAQSIGLWAMTAIKNITTSAWEAMAGAWKAMVGVPYVGPVLAVGAAAAAFAGVMALTGNIKSASGGYDIPAGVNPMTQLHEQEMVLPAHIANPLRNMISDGGSGAGGGDTHVHISAVDAKSIKRLLRDNGREITSAVKSAVKDGYRG